VAGIGLCDRLGAFRYGLPRKNGQALGAAQSLGVQPQLACQLGVEAQPAWGRRGLRLPGHVQAGQVTGVAVVKRGAQGVGGNGGGVQAQSCAEVVAALSRVGLGLWPSGF